MKINLPPSGVCGIIEAIVAHKVDADGNIVSSRHLAGPFKNIITDQGLNRMGDNKDYVTCCQVGSGNDTPTASDTALETWVAGTNTLANNVSRSGSGSAPYYVSCVFTYRFPAGSATGNLSEVGVGWATSGSALYSRALILDGGGSPTTITVLSDEILDVTYQHRTYSPTTDVVDEITISGDTYDYTLRAALANTPNTTGATEGTGWGIHGGFTHSSAQCTDAGTNYAANYMMTGAIGSVTSQPSGTRNVIGGFTNVAYSNNSLYRESILNWGLAQGNSTFTSVVFSFGWCCYQIQFDPVIPKDNTKVLELTFRHSWSRATIP